MDGGICEGRGGESEQSHECCGHNGYQWIRDTEWTRGRRARMRTGTIFVRSLASYSRQAFK